jgi:hypothetical protein
MALEEVIDTLKRLPEQPSPHPGGELASLRRAIAALQQHEQPLQADAPRGAPLRPGLGESIELLAKALLSPPEELFADLSGAPKAPEGELRLFSACGMSQDASHPTCGCH